ncbi:hypothetical protein TNCV_1275721 [Trichonephila clavipes]|nr:hypothetical protein TNCV_1275721 [Trichonephila clavipes]
MLNDDEIVTSVQAESDPVDDETDEDEDNNNESSKYPSNAVFTATVSEGIAIFGSRAAIEFSFGEKERPAQRRSN